MSVFLWILVGLAAGFIATRLLGGGGGLLYNLAIGLVGAVLGGWLFGALGVIPEPGVGPQLVSATVGALVFLLIWRAIRRA